MDYNYQNVQQPPVKKSKTAMIIIIIVAFILLVAGGIFAWIFISASIDKKNAEEMVDNAIEAYGKSDATYLSSITPDFLGVSKSDYEEAFSFMEMLGTEFELVSRGDALLMDKDEIADLEDEIEDEYDEKIQIEKACVIETRVDITMSAMGVEETNENNTDFICIKLSGEWYMYSGY